MQQLPNIKKNEKDLNQYKIEKWPKNTNFEEPKLRWKKKATKI